MSSYQYDRRPWTLNSERQGKTHWTKTTALTREWRTAFWALGLQRPAKFDAADVLVEVYMRSPIADTGACFPAVKAAIDGLVDAKILPGDTPEFVRSITFVAPVRIGKQQKEAVRLTLTPAIPGR